VKASGKPVFGANGEFRGYRGTATDVTASIRAQEEHERLRELESHLAHMNRVSVMGELAASLVHEITQPIATARNNARAAMHFLDRNPPDLSETREALACLVGDIDRAGKIIDGVRAHVKKAPLRKDCFDLNDAIKDVIVLARSAITKNGVAVHTRLAEGPLIIEGDCVQLQQVALNLILNAAEAMSSVKTGARDLLISTEQSQPDEVLVAVRDSGPGIDPKDLERVFETFYTTKSRGIGMGLSISRSIVAAHGGRLWADVNAPRGAVFRFTLRSAARDSGILLGRLAGPQRRAETLQQTRLVNGLLKVADDSILERAGLVDVVDVGGDEDRWNRVSDIDEAPVEVRSGHSRHLDVGNQAGGFNQAMGCKEIGGRSERLHGVAQRPHEPSHGLAKELIIIDDRDQ
jgi:nitrogen-specific signal transduction histidine kinase